MPEEIIYPKNNISATGFIFFAAIFIIFLYLNLMMENPMEGIGVSLTLSGIASSAFLAKLIHQNITIFYSVLFSILISSIGIGIIAEIIRELESNPIPDFLYNINLSIVLGLISYFISLTISLIKQKES
ncbi:MAG: hypothetical protein IH845_00770 [Nanoarchaeota archaeon]|nr:hypothetical protein [Nanoarchaeota archaeon]